MFLNELKCIVPDVLSNMNPKKKNELIGNWGWLNYRTVTPKWECVFRPWPESN